jgi:2-keto-4-pentenoate hydratase/2-oxohepta-3-ene-1,7-dioic acid hydratase in catechol pathway
MRFVRYQTANNAPRYGWILDDKVGPIEGDLFGSYRRMELETPLDQVRLLAPVVPGKIICVGKNYADHIKELGGDKPPEQPILFLKPPSAVIGPGDAIFCPPQSKQVEHESELTVVIGKKGRWIQPQQAAEYIFGYTIGMDITARDLQRKDGQWTRAKGFDTFLPLGPWIDTELDPSDALITCKVDGELRQMASTREMIYTVSDLVAFISSVMTLMPGDLILTGTPAGIGPLLPGNTIEVSIEGIGSLRNPVRAEPEKAG